MTLKVGLEGGGEGERKGEGNGREFEQYLGNEKVDSNWRDVP
jgi:hypothetical protein